MSQQNLLVIMSDEHRRDAMGVMGHPIAKTPHLDKLAGDGCLFRRAYTASPMCVPTRAAFATGTYVHQNRHWDSVAAYDGQQKSWMHHLRDAGYETTSIGKLHFKSGDNDNGFSQEILPMHIVNETGWLVGLLRKDPPAYDVAYELAEQVGRGRSSYTDYDLAITQAAENWLADPARKAKPFAGFVSLVSPHYPLIAPDAFYDLYDPDEMPLPTGTLSSHPEIQNMARFFDYDSHFDEACMRRAIAAYYGLVSFMDDCVGRVIKALEAAGLAENTTVIYLSDHGEMLGDKGLWTKQVMYEASAGIPMIMRGPDVPAGQIVDSPTHLLDVSATALSLAGLEKPAAWPGLDLHQISFAERTGDDSLCERTLLSEYHDGGSTTGAFMLVFGRYKYVYYAGMPAQLFDLETDPDEEHDLINEPAYQAVSEEGRRRLFEICDPEAVSAQAFRDQAKIIADHGGRQACLDAFLFNATPIPEEVKTR